MITRRRFLHKTAAIALGAAAGVMGYATLYEPDFYELTETDIFIPELPGRFEGFRILQVTDVHHSRLVSLAEVRRVVEIANAAQPDLIALTGDYTTAYQSYIEPCAEALGQLRAPEGVWAVLGNHDHATDGQLTALALQRHKITVFTNHNTLLRRGPDALQLAGLDDWTWNAHDWRRALNGFDNKRPSVLLAHQPRTLDWAEAMNFSLLLSGHTHGGQIRLPLIGEPARLSKDLTYLRGRYERQKTQLYVSRGTGVIGLPIRFGVRPEIAVLRLKRA